MHENLFVLCIQVGFALNTKLSHFPYFGYHPARCKSSLNQLQLPYIRAMHKFDFATLFLAHWMDILTLICACGALTRTLSVCFDAMTDGMARIYILGRNAPDNEPWPDVIGFFIVFVVSMMFMLGLEVNFVPIIFLSKTIIIS